MRAYVSAQHEDGSEVYLEDSFPVVVWELVGRMASLDAAAVNQDVDSMAVFEDGGDEGGDGGVGGEVCSVDCCFAAEGFDGLFGGLVGCVALGMGGEFLGYEGMDGRSTWTRRMFAPASASAIAIAWPMPRVPPVTRAVCPSRENSCCTDAMVEWYFA